MAGLRKLYESARATVWLGDCRDALAEIAPLSCGLLATDPPYGVEWESSFAKNRKFGPLFGDDGVLDVPSILGAYSDKMIQYRHCYVFGYRAELIAEPMRLSSPIEIVWDKGQVGLGDLSLPWGPSHERITFGMCVGSRQNREDGRGALSGKMRKGTVVDVPRFNSSGITRHPTEKPLGLMRLIVESSSMADDLVCDPFCGSGSTLVAAVLLGRRAVGVELDDRYAAISVDRVRAAEAIAARMEDL